MKKLIRKSQQKSRNCETVSLLNRGFARLNGLCKVSSETMEALHSHWKSEMDFLMKVSGASRAFLSAMASRHVTRAARPLIVSRRRHGSTSSNPDSASSISMRILAGTLPMMILRSGPYAFLGVEALKVRRAISFDARNLGVGGHGSFARTFYSERISEIFAKLSQKIPFFT